MADDPFSVTSLAGILDYNDNIDVGSPTEVLSNQDNWKLESSMNIIRINTVSAGAQLTLDAKISLVMMPEFQIDISPLQDVYTT